MTAKDKTTLLLLYKRIIIYTYPTDKHPITAFVTGFEVGCDNNWEFTSLLQEYGQKHLGVRRDADGWPGQINRYAQKQSISWVLAFKQIALWTLTSAEAGELGIEPQQYLKQYVVRMLHILQEEGKPWYDDWMERWKLVCQVNTAWFKSLWTPAELKLLKSVDQLVRRNQVFEESEPLKPTQKVLRLKSKFEALLLQSGYQLDLP